VLLEEGFTRDVSEIGHAGTGDLEIRIQNAADLELSGARNALTRHAVVDGDCESFPLKRWRQAGRRKAAPMSAYLRVACFLAVWPICANRCRPSVNQECRRISKSEIFASANMRKFEWSLLRGDLADGTRWHQMAPKMIIY
jgi:hypothetical protein